ncbi:MAG: prolyl oligopeptidase family serine peptidase [Candidatus Hodarchaeales archaeon]|jgi:prolyl oligopeptidase
MKKLNQDAIQYPETPIRPVEEYLHGTKIVDGYRWLENVKESDVKEWLNQQNAHTRKILDQLPNREKLAIRLEELIRIEDVLLPKETERGIFFRKRAPEDQQPILYFRSKKDPASDIEIINVNKLDPTGLTSIDYWQPSPDGKFLAYGISKDGSEWATLHIMKFEEDGTQKILDEKIERTRFSFVKWDKDASGFYYMRFPDVGEVPAGEEHFHSHVRYHKLGSNPKNDQIIYKNPEKPYEYPYITISEDRSYMIVMSYRFTAVDLYYVDLTDLSTNPKPLLTDSKWKIGVRIKKEFIYFMSNHENPKFSIYKTIKDKLSIEEWKCIISPTNDDILEFFKFVGNKIAVVWQRNVTHVMTVHNLNGELEYEVDIPKNGTIVWDGDDVDFNNLYVNYQSWTDPAQILNHNISSKGTKMFYEKELPIDPELVVVKHVWYPSKDGTKVHMFILHGKNTKLDNSNPTLLYGYGGFGISLTPSFSLNFYSWIESGGIAVIANIRGGGENGDEWHHAGRLDKKQNVFDDFIAAGEYLINQGYCSSKTLGIFGGSNGGLLVGAVAVQRPDLFSAVYCSVPLLDMLRYHHFSLGKTWIPEYGDPDNEEHFKWIYAYSPYHNIKMDSDYPAILFHTAESDSRVEPIHAMKTAAKMQKSDTSNPILLWYETASGHGVGTPITKQIEKSTDMLAFLLWRLKPE